MSSRYTLICFVSDTKPDAPKHTFKSDLGEFSGVQTNVAPTCYSIERLKKLQGDHGVMSGIAPPLSRILAIRTRISNYDGYKREVEAYCKSKGMLSPEFKEIFIEDNCTHAEILNELIQRLQNDAPSSVIIETTGGFRPAITAFSLLARFLMMKGTVVKFSTYANTSTKIVSITEDYQMYALLDATSTFIDTGNAKELNALRSQLNIPDIAYLFKAMKQFHSSVLICNTLTLDDNIKALQDEFQKLKSDSSDVTTVTGVVFKHLLLEMIERKMSFIASPDPLVGVIKWCVDNWHLQQAVTLLHEKLLKKNKCKKYGISDMQLEVIRCLRNSINHAEGKAFPTDMRKEVMDKVDRLFSDPESLNLIKGVVESALKKIQANICS